MHTASECIRPLNAFGRRMHSAADSAARPGWLGRGAGGVGPRRGARGRGGSHPGRAAECIGRRMHSAAECIQRPNAFRGSMHSEAVCIRRQYAIKPKIPKISKNRFCSESGRHGSYGHLSTWAKTAIAARIQCPIPNCIYKKKM